MSNGPALTIHQLPQGVALVGEIDEANADEVQAALAALVDGGPKRIDVDLAGITFFSSAGIRALLGAQQAATAAGVDLRVVNPSTIVTRVLDLTGLLGVLTAGARPRRKSESA